jgi:hypothetical protein
LLERCVGFALQESSATYCAADISDARSPAFADETQKNADATLDKTSARRRLSLVFWGLFGVLIAFEFWRSASAPSFRSAFPTR